jgi:flavin-dependent dehydrogenase
VTALRPAVLHRAQVTAPDGHTLDRPLPGPAWGISRYALDAALVDAAAARGAELCLGATATRLVCQGPELALHVHQGGTAQQITARAVVMACGRHSLPGLIPPAAPRPHRRPQRLAVGVKCHYTGLELRPQVELFLFPGGYAGLSPVEEGRANLCLLATYAAFAAAGRSIPALIAAAAAANPALAARLAGAQPVAETACAVAPVDTAAPATPWQGAPRLGDAAVMLPPLCGDGMAMALRAAEICAPLADAYLAAALSCEEWAHAYRRAWQAEFGARVRLGRVLQRLLLMPGLAGKLLAVGARLPALTDYLIRATRGPVVG